MPNECTKTNRRGAREKETGDLGPTQNARITGNADVGNRIKQRVALANPPPAPEPGRSSFGKSAKSHVSSVDYVGSRTRCEQSSIIFEHCSTLFELCSISSGRITIAKPSGLGMVSSCDLRLLE